MVNGAACAVMAFVLVAVLAPPASASIRNVGWYGAHVPCSTSYKVLGGQINEEKFVPLVSVQVCDERSDSYAQVWALVQKAAPGLLTVGAQAHFWEQTSLSSYHERNVSARPQSYFGSVASRPCDVELMPQVRIVFHGYEKYVLGKKVPPPCRSV